MLNRILNLETPEGRAVYRFINVVLPQGAVGFIVYFVNELKGVPLDGDIQVVSSVTAAALVTAYFKYMRDKKGEG